MPLICFTTLLASGVGEVMSLTLSVVERTARTDRNVWHGEMRANDVIRIFPTRHYQETEPEDSGLFDERWGPTCG